MRDNNLEKLQKLFNREMAKVTDWPIAKKLLLNISKPN